MERRTAVLVTMVAALVAIVATAVAVTATQGGDPWSGHGHMTSRAYDRAGMMSGAWPSSEYQYLAEMVAHHEEAVAAARQLERSHRAEMRAFGAAVVTSQSTQIEQMQSWLDTWYPNRSGQVDYRPMMRDLTGTSGDRLDLTFLQDMVGHHMRAVMMSQQLLRRGLADHEQVEALAVTISDEQHREIVQMRQWLRDWFGAR
jgi:uncharacterized protein (DUF305 family)